MEVWGRLALPGPGSGSEKQDVKGLSGAETVWGTCADLTIVPVHLRALRGVSHVLSFCFWPWTQWFLF